MRLGSHTVGFCVFLLFSWWNRLVTFINSMLGKCSEGLLIVWIVLCCSRNLYVSGERWLLADGCWKSFNCSLNQVQNCRKKLNCSEQKVRRSLEVMQPSPAKKPCQVSSDDLCTHLWPALFKQHQQSGRKKENKLKVKNKYDVKFWN